MNRGFKSRVAIACGLAVSFMMAANSHANTVLEIQLVNGTVNVASDVAFPAKLGNGAVAASFTGTLTLQEVVGPPANAIIRTTQNGVETNRSVQFLQISGSIGITNGKVDPNQLVTFTDSASNQYSFTIADGGELVDTTNNFFFDSKTRVAQFSGSTFAGHDVSGFTPPLTNDVFQFAFLPSAPAGARTSLLQTEATQVLVPVASSFWTGVLLLAGVGFTNVYRKSHGYQTR